MNRRGFVLWVAALLLVVAGRFAHFWLWDDEGPGLSKIEVADTHRSMGPLVHQTLKAPSDAPAVGADVARVSIEQTLARGRQLWADDPTDKNGQIVSVLLALCAARQFSAALALIQYTSTDEHPDWLELVLTHWVQEDPQEALRSLDTILDTNQRVQAFRVLASAWNAVDFRGLAAYAITLPQDDSSDHALQLAFENWSLQDPRGFAGWLSTLRRGPEFDAGAAMIIDKADGANLSAEVAIQWVENIGDPELRQETLMDLVDKWSRSAPAVIEQYAMTARWIDEAQRSKIREKVSWARRGN